MMNGTQSGRDVQPQRGISLFYLLSLDNNDECKDGQWPASVSSRRRLTPS